VQLFYKKSGFLPNIFTHLCFFLEGNFSHPRRGRQRFGTSRRFDERVANEPPPSGNAPPSLGAASMSAATAQSEELRLRHEKVNFNLFHSIFGNPV